MHQLGGEVDLNFLCTTPAVMFVTYILIPHFYHILTVVVETKVAGCKKNKVSPCEENVLCQFVPQRKGIGLVACSNPRMVLGCP